MLIANKEGIRKATEVELAAVDTCHVAAETAYWEAVPYDDAVNEQIRQRYSQSQEFAILRQRTEKPDEFDAYYAYCESCKAYVRGKKGMEASE